MNVAGATLIWLVTIVVAIVIGSVANDLLNSLQVLR